VWATGFHSDYSWIRVTEAVDELGAPVHRRGVTPAPGLYFLGDAQPVLAWLVADRLRATRRRVHRRADLCPTRRQPQARITRTHLQRCRRAAQPRPSNLRRAVIESGHQLAPGSLGEWEAACAGGVERRLRRKRRPASSRRAPWLGWWCPGRGRSCHSGSSSDSPLLTLVWASCCRRRTSGQGRRGSPVWRGACPR
jgi:hypothetical protein